MLFRSQGNENGFLTTGNESILMGHALLLRARPESLEPGLFSRIFVRYNRIPPVYEAGGRYESVGLEAAKRRIVGLE